MKLLFLTPQIPHPPRQGTALRNWGLISHLAARGHRVSLLTFDEGPLDAPLSAELHAACARVERVAVPRRSSADRLRTLVASALPDMAWRLWAPEFARRLQDVLCSEQPDVLQVEGIELARYALDPALASQKLVFDDHNCEYLLQRRSYETDRLRPRRWHAAAYSSVQWRRLHRFEASIVRRANATLCVSNEDRALLQALVPGAQLQVIYNGIDVARYASTESAEAAHTLVFTGKMDFRPNIDAALWLATDVLPKVHAAVPGCRLVIVGQKPHARLDVLRGDPRIEITGEVPDIRPYIAAATVYVAPLLAGGGTRFKLLEAMAMRKAIVSTSLGSEGFAVTHGREMLLADNADSFAGAVLDLLKSQDRRDALGAQAYAFVRGDYDWQSIVPKLEAVYRAL